MNEMDVKTLTDNQGLKVAVIGIGNGGSQVALAAAKKGIPCMVMNTSTKDLDDSVIGSTINAFRIGDGWGSGKDRTNAIELFKSNGNEGIKAIFNNPHFKATVEPANVVFITYSCGGGTGSGIGPIFAQYCHKAYAGKVIIPFGILPKAAESLKAQANTIACVDETSKIGTPYMLADLSFYENESQEVSFKKIGEYMADVMGVIRGDYLQMSAAGMADERDLLTVISEPGYMAVHMKTGITEPMLGNKTLLGFILDEVRHSPACRIQRDGMIQYNLIIANVGSFIDDPLKQGNYDELNNFVGGPKATFNNYAVDDMRTEYDVICVSTGMSLPIDRFNAAKAKIVANKAKFDKMADRSLTEARDATDLARNESTKDIVMGNSKKNSEADLSFLD